MLVVGLVLLSSVAMPAMAALNFASGDAPNPYFETNVEVDEYDMGDFDSALAYYDDSGEKTTLNGEVNRSNDVDDLGTGHVNPFTMTATDIDAGGEFSAFPRTDGDQSALHASEWTTSGAAVSNVTTATGVDALEYAGTASGDSATFTLNSAITSDAEKRYVQIAADISSASGTPTLEIHDSDGDYVAVELYNATANQSNADVLANASGEGHVLQTQIGQLTVMGSGDGTMSEITKITVEGDVNADFSLINSEKKGEYTFGERYVDDDDDDELETEEITEPHGAYNVSALSTLGPTFDDAVIVGLSYPAHVDAASLSADDMMATFSSDNAYPQWDSVADLFFRLQLPSAYDLTFTSPTLQMDQQWPSTRYVSVEVAEDTGDTEFSEIEDSAFTAQESAFDSEGDTVTLDDTISSGDNYVVHAELKLTSDEASAMQSATSGGGGIFGGSGGGLFSLPNLGIAAALGGVIQFLRNGWPFAGGLPMPPLDPGDGRPSAVLGGVANFFANGGRPATLILGSIFGIVFSIARGGIDVIQSIIGLVTSPLDAGAASVSAVFNAFLVEPLGVLIAGADASASSIQQFGIIGLLIGTALILGSYLLLTQYLEEPETPDFIPAPGFPDLPFVGVAEESDDGEEEGF